MKFWMFATFGLLLFVMVTFISACSNNSPHLVTTSYSTAPTATLTPVPTSTPKPIYYYNVYYTVSCNASGSPDGYFEYLNPSGNYVQYTTLPLPNSTGTMTFQSGQGLYVDCAVYSGSTLASCLVTVCIYINGSLALSNTGNPAVISETLP
jgi:hypothetical protein